MERKEIPDSVGFTIDRKCNVFDSDGNKRNTYVNGDGYITASIKLSNGNWVTYGVHRLGAITYLQNDKNCTEVNHRNCDITDNNVNNLEWVTCSQNNIHSEVMRTDNLYPTVYCKNDDVLFGIYLNAHEAGKAVGISALDVWGSIKDNKIINNLHYYHRPFSGNIPKELHKPKEFQLNENGKRISSPIKMLDIFTCEVLPFKSINEAAKFFDTGPSHIFQAIPAGNNARVFKKQYQVAYEHNDFPTLTKDEIDKAITHGPKKVIAYNKQDNTYYLFGSANDFIEKAQLSKKAVTTCLAIGKLRDICSWVAVYHTPENIKNLKDYIAVPAPM